MLVAMLFRLRHPDLPLAFLCVISADRCLFFKALDLAKIAGYSKNPSQFANKTPFLTVKDVVHKDLRLPASLAKTKIYDLEQALRVLGPVLNEEAFQDMFETAAVEVPEDVEPTLNINHAKTITVVGESDVTLGEFIDTFSNESMMYFERCLSTAKAQIKFEVPWCEYYGSREAPETVKLLAKSEDDEIVKTFLYRRIR